MCKLTFLPLEVFEVLGFQIWRMSEFSKSYTRRPLEVLQRSARKKDGVRVNGQAGRFVQGEWALVPVADVQAQKTSTDALHQYVQVFGADFTPDHQFHNNWFQFAELHKLEYLNTNTINK